MIQKLVLALFVSVVIAEFLATGDRWSRLAILPRPVKFLPELLTALAVIYVVVEGTRTRFQHVRPVYWFVFGAFALDMICGVLVNQVEAGPVVAGIRLYLRPMPWFFVAAVTVFTDGQLRTQLRTILVLALLQIPLAIEQRIKTGDGYHGVVSHTGDWTYGTLMFSGTLSVFLIGVICVVLACYERKLLNLRQALFLFALLLVPVSINETKISIIAVPLALLVTFYFSAEPGNRARRVALALCFLGAFAAIFIPIYNYLNVQREYGMTIGEFFTDSRALRRYTISDSDVGAKGEVGRVDGLLVPMRAVASDPVTFTFGYGMGNVSESALGAGFSGRYMELYKSFMTTTFARVLMELGWFGVGLMLAAWWIVFADARFVAARGAGLISAIAAGMTGIILVSFIASVYLLFEAMPALVFLFWYFAGLITGARMRMSLAR